MLKILYPINLIKRFSTVNTSIGYDQFSGSTRECNHLVTPSPWPLCTSQSAFGLVLAMASFFHGYENSVTCFFFALTLILGCMGFWWRDVVRESTFEGNHIAKVQLGLIKKDHLKLFLQKIKHVEKNLGLIDFPEVEKLLHLIFVIFFVVVIDYLILYIFSKNKSLSFLQLMFKLSINLILFLAEVPYCFIFLILYTIFKVRTFLFYVLNKHLKKI